MQPYVVHVRLYAHLFDYIFGLNMCILIRCGVHICWVCVRAFPDSESTYAHMGATHGGIYDNDAEPAANVDLNEQRELLRQAERLRLQREAREALVQVRALGLAHLHNNMGVRVHREARPQEREQHNEPNQDRLFDLLLNYNPVALQARALQEETRMQERFAELSQRRVLT